MTPFKPLSLSRQLFLINLRVILISLFVTIIFLGVLEEVAIDSVEKQRDLITKGVVGFDVDVIRQGDKVAALRFIEKLGQSYDIEEASICSIAQGLLASKGNSPAVVQSCAVPSHRFNQEVTDEHMSLYWPVLDGEKVIGDIVLKVRKDVVIRDFWLYASVLLLALIAGGISAYVLVRSLASKIYWPILRLTSVAKNFSRYSQPGQEIQCFISNREDEIGELYSAFGDMLKELAQRESILKASEEHYKGLFDSVEISIWIEDKTEFYEALNALRDKGIKDIRSYLTSNVSEAWALEEKSKVIEINNATLTLFSAKNQEHFIENVSQTCGRNSITVFIEEVCAFWEGKSHFKTESTFLTFDGVELTCVVSMPIPSNPEEYRRVPVLVYDISDRKRAEEDLKSKQDEQAQIIGAMLDAVITIDENGIIENFNTAAMDLFGYSAEEAQGQHMSMLMPESFRQTHDDYVKRFLRTGGRRIIGVGQEIFGRNKAGKTFPIRMSIAELPAKEDGKRKIIGTCHDLSHEKQQEHQLLRAQKMDALGKLTGGIAHDYNNMLGVILGYSELIQEKFSDHSKLQNYVSKIHHAGERGKSLTGKLMTFAKEKDASSEIVKMNDLLVDVRQMLEKTLTSRIRLDLDLSEDLWDVSLSGGDLEDAIVNMCINAMHAMDEGGLLMIQTRNSELDDIDAADLGLSVSGEYVQLDLVDTGCGMDSETMAKVFDPFYSTKGSEGTGLGLSQVYRFVQRAKGAILVYSEIGVGTRFELYFPRHCGEVKNISIGLVEEKKIKPAVGGRILLVDDEEDLRELAECLLRQQGYVVYTASDGLEALEVLEHEEVDLLLSDVIMPHMDGYQLANKVQSVYPDVKIQLMSGYEESRYKGTSDTRFFENTLRKPISNKALTNRVHELLLDKAG